MKTLFSLLSFLLLFGSNLQAGGKKENIATGTYGICSCSEDAYVSNLVQLQLNPDHTFSYTDNTLGKSSFTMKGTWVQKGKHIVLQPQSDAQRVHLRWKASGEKCISSRKGLNFRRLCMMQKC